MASNEEWRQAAAEYLQALICHVEEKYGDIIYGYFLMCGTTTEWFSDRDYEASHPFKEEYFKKYTGDPDTKIPSQEELILPEDVAFHPSELVKTYRRAHAEQTADTILYFAQKAQEVLQHKKLLGLYFGYLFELAHDRLWNAGHLAYEKVFLCDDIDMVSSPSSYGYRGIDSTSAFMVTYKTLDLHNKLYYLEFDHITHLAPAMVDGFLIPGGQDKCKDQTMTLNLMQRDFMLCAANGAALWWFDMFEGWFYSEEMMGCIADMIRAAGRIGKCMQESAAEIAVIASGETLYGVNKMAHVNDKLLGWQLNGLARMGAPYDLYSAADLPGLAEQDRYKMFIFLDAFEGSADFDREVDALKSRGKTLVWMYAPHYLDGGLAKMCGTTDMELEIVNEAVDSVNCQADLMPAPCFAVCDKAAVSLAEYDNGKSAVAYKVVEKESKYISVYSGVGNLDGRLLNQIARIAGVHIYTDTAPVYVNSALTGVYSFEDVILHMKEDGVYEDVFTGTRIKTKDGKLFVPAAKLASRLFMKV